MTVVTDRPDAAPDAANRRGPRLPRRTVLFAAVGVVLLAVAGVWLVAFSPVLGVRTVRVVGAHFLSAAQVRAAADVVHGTPLVRLDTGAVARRVDALPEVASARVSTSFPGTVVVTVTERQPVGVVARSGRFVLVDRTGRLYRTVADRPARLPEFVVPGSGAAARAVATVAAALPTRLRPAVRSIQALDAGSITVVLTHGRIVQWGSAARSADKARIVQVLMHRADRQLDVSDPDHPFTR